SGHRTGCHDQAILGVIPGNAGGHLVVQNASTEPRAADVLARELGIKGLCPAPTGGEIDAQELACVAGDSHAEAPDRTLSRGRLGEPRTVLGSRRATWRVARKTFFTSNGRATSRSFHAPSEPRSC